MTSETQEKREKNPESISISITSAAAGDGDGVIFFGSRNFPKNYAPQMSSKSIKPSTISISPSRLSVQSILEHRFAFTLGFRNEYMCVCSIGVCDKIKLKKK